MKGIFITFEGTEGSGKTTIIENIANDLTNQHFKVIKTREPGGSKISEEIRSIILNVKNTQMDAITEALLYAASRRQHISEVVLPHLNQGYIVLCDRYIDSSLAYQGYARNLGIDAVYQMNQFATEGLLPDLTIYIDVKPQVGLNRIQRNHRTQDRLDLETIEFHNKVYQGYLEVAKKFPDRFIIVPGEHHLDEVYQDVKKTIFSFLKIQDE